MGALLREKRSLQQLHSKKGGGLIFEGGPIFKRLRYMGLFTHLICVCVLCVYRGSLNHCW